MKIKTFVLAALLGATVTSGSWAIGIGALFNGNIATGGDQAFIPGWAIAVSSNRNLHFSAYWSFAEEASILGLTADLWVLNPQIVQLGSAGSLGFFFGPGMYGSFSTAAESGIALGIRLPIGVNLRLAQDVFEVFVQAAPSWALKFYPSLGLEDHLLIPVSVGLRFWLPS
jgi:hypothetical protein